MKKIEGEIPKDVWHVIASKSSKQDGAGWRQHDDAVMSIDAAREAHDGGVIEMAQGRDGERFFLKVMFRRKADEKRRPWFFRTESEHDKAMKRPVNYVRGTRAKRKEVAA